MRSSRRLGMKHSWIRDREDSARKSWSGEEESCRSTAGDIQFAFTPGIVYKGKGGQSGEGRVRGSFRIEEHRCMVPMGAFNHEFCQRRRIEEILYLQQVKLVFVIRSRYVEEF
jgi:hypothetical protein